MDFRILGPLEVVADGQEVPLGGAKQRALLALLLLHPNRVVSRDRLIDELWETDPPETARTALQVHVSHLRKALGRDRIVTQAPGYLVRLEPDDELQRLERAILNHDPSLESPVVPGVKAPSVAWRRRASSRTEAPVPPDSVAVVDPQRSRVVGHVLVGRRPVAVAIGHGSVWVANADDGTVSRIHPDRREVIRTIGIGAPAIDLAVATDAVWVANGSDGTVSRIDPRADAVVETIDLRGSSELAWNPTYAVDADDESVWIAAGPHHVLRIDPKTNEPFAIIDVGRVPVSVALGEEAPWAVTTRRAA